ncbi:ankyrin repeat domain-containing protein [Tenuifilum sp.]|uniref:ankyrin repeat domain-containing protein n=1 Tax=Tenuifilum sp. TaxID=2760880 RepID=UPI00258A29A1|nr:ankyrin repeat domain-containing protein [Tenuifilum sp.]
MMNIRSLFLLLLFLLSFNRLHAQISADDSYVVSVIKSGNIAEIEQIIKTNGLEKKYFNNSHTLLTLAISQGNFSTAKYIIDKGANLNVVLKTNTPLIICAIYDKDSIADYLLKNGANVNQYNIHKNTPLLYASRLGSIKTLNVLLKYRANPYFKNFQNYNSIEYAQVFGKDTVVSILTDYMVAYSKGIYPSCFDGPHVELKNRKWANAFYLVNDSLNSKIFLVSQNLRIKNQNVRFKGFFEGDTLGYTINFNLKYNLDNDTYVYEDKTNKIFAIGDIHGAYDNLVELLMNNQVIDQEMNWKFGKNHLVFIGDLVDRGEKVTEVLWLLNKLVQQSQQAGGHVHFLIGNHELLAIGNDNRYINEKYQILTHGNRITYSGLFKPNVWPGSILRFGKSAIIIDSILFVHAGISKEIADEEISLNQMNQIVYRYLNPDHLIFTLTDDQFLDKLQKLFSKSGIFWYRGYMFDLPEVPKATQADLNYVLSKYKAREMIIGHTEVDSIAAAFESKLFPINVPFNDKHIKPQALLIDENRNYWRCYIDGSRIKLK